MRGLFLLPLLALAVASQPALAGGTEPEAPAAPLTSLAPRAVKPEGLAAQPWYRPHHLVLQTAGGQGMITAGVGYTALRGRIDLDALAGYVPSKYSITPMGIFTGKVGYSPWLLTPGQGRWQVKPFTIGGLINYTVSDGLNDSRDGKYEKGYYWWSSRTRVGGFVGGKVARVVGTNRFGQPRTLGAYYELGTNDLYISSIFSNVGGLGVHEILTLGFGLKLDL